MSEGNRCFILRKHCCKVRCCYLRPYRKIPNKITNVEDFHMWVNSWERFLPWNLQLSWISPRCFQESHPHTRFGNTSINWTSVWKSGFSILLYGGDIFVQQRIPACEVLDAFCQILNALITAESTPNPAKPGQQSRRTVFGESTPLPSRRRAWQSMFPRTNSELINTLASVTEENIKIN